MVRCFNLVSCVGEREGRDAASPEGSEKKVKLYDLSEVWLVQGVPVRVQDVPNTRCLQMG